MTLGGANYGSSAYGSNSSIGEKNINVVPTNPLISQPTFTLFPGRTILDSTASTNSVLTPDLLFDIGTVSVSSPGSVLLAKTATSVSVLPGTFSIATPESVLNDVTINPALNSSVTTFIASSNITQSTPKSDIIAGGVSANVSTTVLSESSLIGSVVPGDAPISTTSTLLSVLNPDSVVLNTGSVIIQPSETSISSKTNNIVLNVSGVTVNAATSIISVLNEIPGISATFSIATPESVLSATTVSADATPGETEVLSSVSEPSTVSVNPEIKIGNLLSAKTTVLSETVEAPEILPGPSIVSAPDETFVVSNEAVVVIPENADDIVRLITRDLEWDIEMERDVEWDIQEEREIEVENR